MSGLSETKTRVRDFWSREPCGTGENPFPAASSEYFGWLERQRDERETFIARFAHWSQWRDHRVLEMGTGAGTDFVRFARAGAKAYGIDLTETGINLVRRRLGLEGLTAGLAVGDVEQLPFATNYFDFVYSWGVIHHTENPEDAAREAIRVLKPGGRFCVMVYHRYSLHCLRGYLKYGLLKARPLASIDAIARDHFESYGTKVYTQAQARALFPDIDLTITHVLTPYDLQYSREGFVPRPIGGLIPSFFGYFMVLEGRKPQGGGAA